MPDFRRLLAKFPLQHVVTPHGMVGYREHGIDGGGIPVVLLHGIGSGSASWVCQLEAIGAVRPVFAWDAPGYGESAPVAPREPCPIDYALALASWMDALGLARCMLVGHSLGAIMAAAVAARWPERVAGLLLLSPASGYAGAEQCVRIEKRDNRLRMLEELGPQGLAEQRSANLLSPDASADAQDWVRWNMARIRSEGYAQATHLLANADLADDAARYAGPTAIAVGGADAVTTPTSCEAVLRKLQQHQRSVDYHVFDGLGHACYIEAPDTVTAHIVSFIEQYQHNDREHAPDSTQ